MSDVIPPVQQYALEPGAKTPMESAQIQATRSAQQQNANNQKAGKRKYNGGKGDQPPPGTTVVPQVPSSAPSAGPVDANANSQQSSSTILNAHAQSEFDNKVGKGGGYKSRKCRKKQTGCGGTIRRKKRKRNITKKRAARKNKTRKRGGEKPGFGERVRNIITYARTPKPIRDDARNILRKNKAEENSFASYSDERESMYPTLNETENPWRSTMYSNEDGKDSIIELDDEIQEKEERIDRYLQEKMKTFVTKYAAQEKSGCLNNIDSKYLKYFNFDENNKPRKFSSEEQVDNYFKELDSKLTVCVSSSKLIKRTKCVISNMQRIIDKRNENASEIARSATSGVVSDATKKIIEDKKKETIKTNEIKAYVEKLNSSLDVILTQNVDSGTINNVMNVIDKSITVLEKEFDQNNIDIHTCDTP